MSEMIKETRKKNVVEERRKEDRVERGRMEERDEVIRRIKGEGWGEVRTNFLQKLQD